MSSRTKLNAFLALSFALLIALALFRGPNRFSRWENQRFWLGKVSHAEKYDLVAYGDSRTLRGFAPRAFCEIDAYNFAFRSGDMTPQIIDESVRRLKRSGVLLLGVTPSMFLRQEQYGEHFTSYFLLPDHKGSMLAFQSKYLGFLEAIDLRKTIGESVNASVEVPKYMDDGWLATTMAFPDRRVYKHHYTQLYKQADLDNDLVSRTFQKLAQLHQEGYQTYGFFPPTEAYMDSLDFRVSGFDSTAFKERFKALGGQWLPVSRDTYHTYDGSHLDKQEALRFSEDLWKTFKTVSSAKAKKPRLK